VLLHEAEGLADDLAGVVVAAAGDLLADERFQVGVRLTFIAAPPLDGYWPGSLQRLAILVRPLGGYNRTLTTPCCSSHRSDVDEAPTPKMPNRGRRDAGQGARNSAASGQPMTTSVGCKTGTTFLSGMNPSAIPRTSQKVDR
jgi:hypothetical protein